MRAWHSGLDQFLCQHWNLSAHIQTYIATMDFRKLGFCKGSVLVLFFLKLESILKQSGNVFFSFCLLKCLLLLVLFFLKQESILKQNGNIFFSFLSLFSFLSYNVIIFCYNLNLLSIFLVVYMFICFNFSSQNNFIY